MPKIPVPDVLLRTLGRQLGGPSGPLGTVVARMLNKGNAATIRAAVEALELTGGETAADIGFGGGLGLDLLLAGTGESGRVHGVEPSGDMVTRARRTHAAALADGRLELHEAPMEALPFPDGTLDGWISLNTIYFVADLAPAARELARVLAPSGRGVLGVADPDWMASQAFTKHNFTLRPVAEVVATLEASDLTVEDRTLTGRMPYHLLVCRPTR
ncbi:methyltransferase domain-containing protein [Nocardioides immobilis]|nr:methyltransferase domain-containing protein [Nocardioides immobilis]